VSYRPHAHAISLTIAIHAALNLPEGLVGKVKLRIGAALANHLPSPGCILTGKNKLLRKSARIAPSLWQREPRTRSGSMGYSANHRLCYILPHDMEDSSLPATNEACSVRLGSEALEQAGTKRYGQQEYKRIPQGWVIVLLRHLYGQFVEYPVLLCTSDSSFAN
jgi:hypothetical protein